LAPSLDHTEAFPTESLKALGRAGLLGVNIDERWGGLEAGVYAYVLAVRALAEHCAATTVAMMVTNMVAEAIQSFGNDEQRERYLSALRRGDWPALAFSLSEPDSGSDAASLKAIARRDGGHYILNGVKSWVTSGGHAGVYLVMASTDPSKRSRGISAFLVDPGLPGFTITRPEEKTGLRGSSTTQLVFEDCRIPASALLGEEGIGFKIAMSSLDGGRVGVSAQACGVAFAALRDTALWLAAPERADDPRQTVWRESFARHVAELEAAWSACEHAARLKDKGLPLTREAAISKLHCTETANRVCAAMIDIVGVEACHSGMRLEQYLRDVRVTRIYEGTSEVQRIVIAREALKASMRKA